MIWSQPTSAYCWTASAHSSGLPTMRWPAAMRSSSCSGVGSGNQLRPRRHAGRAREGVEVPEDQAGVVAVAHGAARRRRAALPSSRQTSCGDAGDVVVDVVADRLGVLDVVLVDLDQRREVLRRAEAEAERAEAEARRLLEGRRAAARHPDRRVRLAVRLRQHVALGHREELALVAVLGLAPHAQDLAAATRRTWRAWCRRRGCRSP